MTTDLDWQVGAPAQPPEGALALLTAAFAEPPYAYPPARLARRLDAWDGLLGERGFRCVEARRGGRLVGIAWGWPTRGLVDGLYAGLYRTMRASLGSSMLLLRGTEVVEVAVHPAAQGEGIGGQLLDRLTDGGPGWLLARADAPAAAWYRRHGWQHVGSLGQPGAAGPVGAGAVDARVALEVLVRS